MTDVASFLGFLMTACGFGRRENLEMCASPERDADYPKPREAILTQKTGLEKGLGLWNGLPKNPPGPKTP